MSDTKKLEEMPHEALLQELRAREAKTKGLPAALAPHQNEALRNFDSETIYRVLYADQKGIYNRDNRVDVFDLPEGQTRIDADSVAALFSSTDLTDTGQGTSKLLTQNFGTSRKLCTGERFREQPTGAFCSGFLVAPDIFATAGHCVNAGNVDKVRFVFGFRMRDKDTAETVISNTEIYRGVQFIDGDLDHAGADWALVRVDRPVTNHPVVRIRRTGKIEDGQAVHVIGHPVGLPAKFADGAIVRDNRPNEFFVANLDTYGGNSGSPVFNSETHEVEGILVRGERDFVTIGNCQKSLVCPELGCRGEDCTRTTEFATLIQQISDA
jgi:hypothetical protein